MNFRSSAAAALVGFLGFSAPLIAAEVVKPPTFKCVGFAEPLNGASIDVERGRVLPLRAQLARPDGTFADVSALKARPIIKLVYKKSATDEEDVTEDAKAWDYGDGNQFVFDPEAHWKFDMGTNDLLDEGNYTVTLGSGDESEYRVDPTCSFTFKLTLQ